MPIDPLTITSGEEFRAWREESPYTVRGLADTLGVSRHTIERWQRGQPPPPRVALWGLAGLDHVRRCPLVITIREE